jgi:Interferon-induced transmembrane protein
MTQPPPPGYPPQPPAAQAPNNHLVRAIIGILFCLPFGIVAIVKASQVSGLWAQGQYDAAQASANSAKKWANWSIIIGIVVSIIYVILAVVGGLAAQNTNAAAMLVTMF